MSPSSHGPLTSEQATVLTERAAVAQGVGGASATSRKTKASSGPEIPLGGKKPGVLQPAGGPHVLIYGLSPCPFRTKKNFPPPADNLLCSHHLKLCGCEGEGAAGRSHAPLARRPRERIQAVDRIPVSCQRASTSAASHSLFLNGRMGSRARVACHTRDYRLKKIKPKPSRVRRLTQDFELKKCFSKVV